MLASRVRMGAGGSGLKFPPYLYKDGVEVLIGLIQTYGTGTNKVDLNDDHIYMVRSSYSQTVSRYYYDLSTYDLSSKPYTTFNVLTNHGLMSYTLPGNYSNYYILGVILDSSGLSICEYNNNRWTNHVFVSDTREVFIYEIFLS